MTLQRDPTKRFSDRVDYYLSSRPGYPREVIDVLTAEAGLSSRSEVADVGSGTGILSEMFLKAGCRVFAVEPNFEMRSAAEAKLSEYRNFISVNGRAEDTSLMESCVDFVSAGQAFHWFDRDPAKREFLRILKPGGWAMIVWNTRRTDSTPFLIAYESLLRAYSLDYSSINHTNITARQMSEFLGPHEKRVFTNIQPLDFDGLKGRLLSSSYVPMHDHQNYEPMIAELQRIFGEYESAGKVSVEYDTEMYYAKVK
ncbi:MAG: class I SAM-dependent methyltransferase [Blastocatellia bacterium]